MKNMLFNFFKKDSKKTVFLLLFILTDFVSAQTRCDFSPQEIQQAISTYIYILESIPDKSQNVLARLSDIPLLKEIDAGLDRNGLNDIKRDIAFNSEVFMLNGGKAEQAIVVGDEKHAARKQPNASIFVVTNAWGSSETIMIISTSSPASVRVLSMGACVDPHMVFRSESFDFQKKTSQYGLLGNIESPIERLVIDKGLNIRFHVSKNGMISDLQKNSFYDLKDLVRDYPSNRLN